MGQYPTLSDATRDVYDNPLTNGTMALLGPVDVSRSDELPHEILAIVKEYQVGRIGTIDFASRMEPLRLKSDVLALTK